MIINHVFKSRRKLRKVSSLEKLTSNESNSKKKKIISKKDLKFAITSLSLNGLFLTLNFPICVLNIYLSNTNADNFNSFIGMFFVNLYYAYFGVSFYISLLVNSIFRDEFLAMIKLKTHL